MSAVRVRLIVELRMGTRSIDVDLPETPTVGETIELVGGRRCIVEKVIDGPKHSTLSHYVYATADQAEPSNIADMVMTPGNPVSPLGPGLVPPDISDPGEQENPDPHPDAPTTDEPDDDPDEKDAA